MKIINNIFNYIDNFKEQQAFEEQLKRDGLEVARERVLRSINQKIRSQSLALEFILQELDFVREDYAFVQFIESSGFHFSDYAGALEKFKENRENLDEIQSIFNKFLNKIRKNDLMVETAIKLLDSVMKEWKIGQYTSDFHTVPKAKLKTERISSSSIIKEDVNIPDNHRKVEVEEVLDTISPIYPPKEVKIKKRMPSPVPIDTPQYDTNKVNDLMEEYSDIIENIIVGSKNPKEKKRIDEFTMHMTFAALQGDALAKVFCCFSQQKEPYASTLPINIGALNNTSILFLIEILNSFVKKGFSNHLKNYLEENKSEVRVLANENNMYMQYLLGFWYSCPESKSPNSRKSKECLEEERRWYEKSALNGFNPAILRMGELYNDGDEISDLELKKSAYWYRQSALKNSVIDMYNLALAYALGEGVHENMETASLWFSLAYEKANGALQEQILKDTKALNIQVFENPNINLDPELNSQTAEFLDLYRADSL